MKNIIVDKKEKGSVLMGIFYVLTSRVFRVTLVMGVMLLITYLIGR